MASLGERLRQLRVEKSLTQEELGKAINVAKSSISQYESDDRQPSMGVQEKLCDFFSVSLDYLHGRSNDRTTPPQTSEEKEIDDYFNQVAAQMEGLMFSGKPMSAESKEKVIQALRVGIEMAKQDEERRRLEEE